MNTSVFSFSTNSSWNIYAFIIFYTHTIVARKWTSAEGMDASNDLTPRFLTEIDCSHKQFLLTHWSAISLWIFILQICRQDHGTDMFCQPESKKSKTKTIKYHSTSSEINLGVGVTQWKKAFSVLPLALYFCTKLNLYRGIAFTEGYKKYFLSPDKEIHWLKKIRWFICWDITIVKSCRCRKWHPCESHNDEYAFESYFNID